MKRDKVAFLASRSETAQAAMETLRVHNSHVAPEQADVIVALGGDEFVLQTLNRFMDRGMPVYGMNRGSVGFLMNAYAEENLLQRIEQASEEIQHPRAAEGLGFHPYRPRRLSNLDVPKGCRVR